MDGSVATILLIDDNVSLLTVMADVLIDVGHSISAAKDGQQALLLVDSTQFDLIITDIHMPNMDGIELLIELRKRVRGQKIIVMSGSGQDSIDGLRTATLLGALSVMNKPFAMRELRERVTAVLGNPDQQTN
jgi:DNA-binding response OmpR family regulator